MAQIIDLIAGESLTIENIVQDDGSDTPFGEDYICYAEAFNNRSESISEQIVGHRDSVESPFTINILPAITDTWFNNITIVVSVQSNDKSIVGKSKLLLKVEKFA